MVIKVLPVLHGDSICINYLGKGNDKHNVLIDGGFQSTYSKTLKKEVERIYREGEKIDLLIVTHTDQDHIGGVRKLIQEFGETDLIQEVWFNFSFNDQSYKTDSLVSINDGISLRDRLEKIGKLPESNITYERNAKKIDGLKLTILSPTQDELNQYQINWEKYEAQQEELISIQDNDYHQSVDVLSRKKFVEDNSPENRASISVLIEFQGKKLLCLADTPPSILINTLGRMGYSKENKLRVDYLKVSHHGSKFNTNNKLLSLIECQNYIISANGKNRYFFPHKECLSRIVKNNVNKETNFLFNYDNNVLRKIFSESEQEEHNVSCTYQTHQEYGLILNI